MKRTFLWLVCLCLLVPCVAGGRQKALQARRVRNPKVRYAPASKVRTFPFPAVNFERGGLARPTDEKEIMDAVVYPLVNKSPKPIAAFVVTFFRDNPNIGVLVIWHDTSFVDAIVERDARGHFKADSYKRFLLDEEVH
ncbi:MAG TPA: hypothetical protein VGX48_11145 [Pyrinomonadaceae bacterium]|jgi:hypothetical protein|nr:hypothetical protein [Pyrinomonadaceae bacterium]